MTVIQAPAAGSRRASSPRAGVRLWLLLGAGLAGALAAAPAGAQAPLAFVNDSTRVSSISFRFDSTQTLDERTFVPVVATREPTGICEAGFLARAISWLPFCGEAGVYPLLPVELQRDVHRLERHYRRNGFPFPRIDYEVALDTARNNADVTFSIVEGPPLRIATLAFLGPGGAEATEELPRELDQEWRDLVKSTQVGPGDRLDDFALVRLQGEVLAWLRERGFAHATVSASIAIEADTMAMTPARRRALGDMLEWLRTEQRYEARVAAGDGIPRADVQVKLHPGPLARYDSIRVAGAVRVNDGVLLRELPFERGDVFRQSELTEGQRQIFGLNLFQLAAVDVTPRQRVDSTVNIRVTVTEAPARTLSGRAGFFSESGVTGEVDWTHRDFLGDARSLTVSLQGLTGVGAFPSDGYPDRRYRLGVSLRQPYVLDRRLSALFGPYVEYREDEIETARRAGADATLLYEASSFRTAALTYSYSRRAILDRPGGGLVDAGGLLFDSLVISRGELRLTAGYGQWVDNALNPTRGLILRPLIAVAGLAPGSVRYGTATLSATAILPLRQRWGVVARAGGGFLEPFGGTDLSLYAEDYTGTRDVLMYAGGTGDVRGWASNLLGPKFFDIRIPDPQRLLDILGGVEPVPAADTFYSEVVIVRPYYQPIGGQRRVFGSMQLNVPLPLGPNWGASAFVDAGRVWAPAGFVFNLADTLAITFPNLAPALARLRSDAEHVRVGVGAGLQYLTPVGFLSVAVGVKVNPSYADMRRPEDVWRELDIYELTGEPPNLGDVEERWSRRLQFHLSIGQRF